MLMILSGCPGHTRELNLEASFSLDLHPNKPSVCLIISWWFREPNSRLFHSGCYALVLYGIGRSAKEAVHVKNGLE